MKPKVIYHHENLDNPHRCFVRLYKLYMNLCPADSFYLMPLHNPSATCWYSTRPLGYHKLGTTVAHLYKSAEIPGTKPIILSGSLLRQDCSVRLWDWWTVGHGNYWALQYWRSLHVLTKEHLKLSVKQFRTPLVQRGSAFNTPSLPKNLNPLKLF